MNKLGEEKERLQSSLHDGNYYHRLAVATDHWEEMVKPFLVCLKTGSVGEGNEAVEKLGIQEEVDRLFNFTEARPSRVRELLQSLETKVTCFFQVKPNTDKRSKGLRHHYDLDHGRVSITLNGIATGLQQEDMGEREAATHSSAVSRRIGPGRRCSAPPSGDGS
jgi:hypothetical protein